MKGQQHENAGPNGRTSKFGMVFLTTALALNFQFFFSVGESFEAHPLAPSLFLEIVLSALIVWTFSHVFLKMAARRLDWLDLVFFLVPLVFVLPSALSAWHKFDQPILVGIGEDRRIFSFYFWFVFRPLLSRFNLTSDDVILSLIYCALIYLVAGLIVRYGFSDALLERDVPDFDPRKLRISSPGECFGLCAAAGIVLLLHGRYARGTAAAMFGWAGLLVVAQFRQVIIAVAFATVFALIAAKPLRSLLIFCPVFLLFIFAATQISRDGFFDETVRSALPNIDEFSGEQLAFNTRTNTLLIVLDAIKADGFIGLGALSKRYDTGLQFWYGRNFYINDVGVFGEIYRNGAISIALYVVLWSTHLVHLLRIRRSMEFDMLATFLMMLLFLFTAGWLYRYGFMHSFIVLFALSAVPRCCDARLPYPSEVRLRVDRGTGR